MAMLMTHKVIAEIAIMAILAKLATIVMGNFSMAIRGIQLKSIKTSQAMLYSYEFGLLFRRYQLLQCKNANSLRPIS